MFLTYTKAGPNAKPPKNVSKMPFRKILLLMAVGVSTLLLLIRQVHPKHFIEKKALLLLDDCQHARIMQVCSHQLLNAPPSSSSPTSPPDGSIEAMEALWKAGIHCFDVDVVTLSDGTQVVTHPSRLAALNTSHDQFTLAQARAAGADERRFPLLQTLLEAFARLVQEHRKEFLNNNMGVDQSMDNKSFLTTPWLNIDLKQGPHLTVEHLQHIQDAIVRLQLEHHVVLCATAIEPREGRPLSTLVDVLQVLETNDAPLAVGLTLRDQVPRDWNVTQIQGFLQRHPAIRILVASHKFDIEYFHRLALSKLPIAGWTVDQDQELRHAIQARLSAIISNDPVRLSQRIAQWSQCANSKL